MVRIANVFQVSLQLAYGLLAEERIALQTLDHSGNSTAPLLSIADITQLGAVLDIANSTISSRGRGAKVAKSKTGLLVMPITKSACERRAYKRRYIHSNFPRAPSPNGWLARNQWRSNL